MKAFWQFLAALWPDDAVSADYPAVPGGQVPTLQSDGTVKWSAGSVVSGEILVDDATGEILIDDETGNVLYDG
jgi:hypothetical protein